ncbi:segregation and condensation protein A [Marivirga arenosa]|uniref:Segregation and condensation protein A n=1 Tax=Marivirga arenosa TaxID=3059076 RepID=A0AA52EXB0_9BACT|nr:MULTISPECIES: segregation/condensation protein A [unclassified Marivirga]WMN06211.1 segregation/condensation protein A [Marivirga sp. ABR2-2]WNB17466.1 segregation/condensation protein A [Marivirga sp. BKB1-2]
MSFEIKLPLFEGPFDLLLFFIERDELDIYDIPISKITNDFLDYLKHLEQMNIEVASEFILVASTLMRIKAKMLLPRPQMDEEGNEIDPREELVRHLLEYKKYKSVLQELSEMEGKMQEKEKRGNVKKEVRSLSETINVEAELQNVDLYKLLRVFRDVMARYELEKNKPSHKVVQYPYTIEGQKTHILGRLELDGRMAFTSFIEEKPEKIAVIFNFLAILELLQSSLITITVGEGFNNFWLEKIEKVAE